MLEIPLPDADKQVIPAKVARALGTEYGFQFAALTAEQRSRIRATLKGHRRFRFTARNNDYWRALPAKRRN